MRRDPWFSAPTASVTLTVTRVFEMDVERVLAEPGFKPPSADTPRDEVEEWLKESFFELCGFDREQDHIDGSYVRLLGETGDNEWAWPTDLLAGHGR